MLNMLLLAIIFGLPIGIIGLSLLKRGRWPRRFGDEPHCLACDYLLIGLESGRCPECGAMIDQKTIVRGHRVRQPGMAWGGMALILLSLLMISPAIVGIVRDINWNRFKPASMLIGDVKSGSFDWYASLQELFRREQDGTLSDSNARALTDVALQTQVATTPPPSADELMQFAQRQYTKGTLTEAQKKQLVQQAAILSMRIRRTIALGDPVPYEISHPSRIASPWWVRISDGAVSIDGKEVRPPNNGGVSASSGLGSGGSSGSGVPCNTPGVHTLAVASHIEIYPGNFGQQDPNTLIHSEDRVATGTFEVIAKPPPDFFTMIDDPKLAAPIKASITPTDFAYGKYGFHRIEGMLKIAAVPTNVAFEVIARWNGQDHNMNFVTARTGGSTNYELASDPFDDSSPPTKIDIVLRSNEKAARNTVDMDAAWKGEIVIEGVEVKDANAK